MKLFVFREWFTFTPVLCSLILSPFAFDPTNSCVVKSFPLRFVWPVTSFKATSSESVVERSLCL